ncbi:MAG: hypothetical protein WD049_10250 [Candidatus Paceibacterota bacterium]
MLYILHGSDYQKRNAKLRQLLAGLEKKRPNAELFKLEAGDITPGRLEELCGGQGLFDQKFIVVIDQVLDDPEARETLSAFARSLGESENVFILVENAILKTTLKKFEKHAEKVEEFSAVNEKGSVKKEVNNFAIADALGRRDRKALWVEYHKLLRAHKVPEEINGTLFWQLKAIAIARQAASAKEARMKEFPYKKARGFANNYSEEELYALLSDLVERYHRARRGEGTLETQLEQFVLGV